MTDVGGKKGLQPALQASVHGQTLEEAFPECDPPLIPVGNRVLLQVRSPKEKTAGGVYLSDDSREAVKWNTQIARVVSLGALAFRRRTDMEPWPEGNWCEVGDFVRVPKWGADRFEFPTKSGEGKALFVIANDTDIIAKVLGDPLAINEYVD